MRRAYVLLLLISGICLLLSGVAPRANAQPGVPTPPIGDALIPPPPPPALAAGEETLRGLSQYMAGHVAVRVVLPESNGAIDPSQEDWTPSQIAQIQRDVETALDWWAALLPQAKLRFSIRLEVVPTSYEPIRYGLREEHLWIADTLGRLGFRSGNHFDRAYAAGYSHRDELGADWATTIFVVNSDRHPNGYFSDGYFAYAYIGGPFMVITSDVGAYGASRMAPIVAHEIGHVFGALDQYAVARVPCTARSGYLHAPTTNSQYGNCGTNAPSIMLEPISAFAHRQIDPSALAQIGYVDSDGDGLIDPLTTMPNLDLVDLVELASSQRPILAGTAREVGYPAPLQTPASIHTLSAIEYRVNGGAWQRIPAADGAYDSRSERFETELALYDGDYIVELRAVNSAGRASAPITRRVLVSGVGAAPTYAVEAPALVTEPQVAFRLNAPAETSGVQISADPLFEAAEWQPFTTAYVRTLPLADGTQTFYVRFRDAAGRNSLAFAVPVTLDTTPPEGTAVFDLNSGQLLLDVADSGSGVAAVEIRIAGHEPFWLAYSSGLALPEVDGSLLVRFRDRAGNLSALQAVPAAYIVRLPLIVG
jgi:hypothetical protein